jgi:hypothetical protein
MYSPRIRDDLIPGIYRAAKASGVPMTVWVCQAIEQALAAQQAIQEEVEQYKKSVVRRPCSHAQRRKEEGLI